MLGEGWAAYIEGAEGTSAEYSRYVLFLQHFLHDNQKNFFSKNAH